MRPERGTWLVLLVIVGVAGARLLTAPEPALLAWPGGEVYGHAWVQWWHGLALPAWPDTPPLAEVHRWVVMDPLPTALAGALGRLCGWTFAWNALVIGAIALAFAGGAALARRLQGAPLVGGAVMATAPIFLGSLASGLTEDAALGLVPLSAAFLLGPSLGAAALGGALLGLTAWCGLYLAWFGALLAVFLGLTELLAAARGGGLPRALGRWGLAAAVAILLAAPALRPHLDRVSGGHRAGAVTEQVEPAWKVNPWRGADLAAFVAPGQAPLQGDELLRLHPTYLGWIALALALAGGRSRWWLVLLGAALMAPGQHLRLAGEPLGVENPVAVWAWRVLPFSDLINHHARWMLLGQVALAVLAARGARSVIHRVIHTRPPDQNRIGTPGMIESALPLAIALGTTVEIATLSPAPFPLPLTPAAVDPLWSLVPPGEGALLPVPAGGPGVHFQRPLYEQRAHGRPLLVNPNRPGPPPGLGPLGAWLAGLGHPGQPPAPEADLSPLKRAGVSVIVARAPTHTRAEEVLGPPWRETPGGAIWLLEDPP
ncbi:MAG: hypothetical protein H6739_10005 [Alphaproteobacteria bacterium]|nr:hypothetical protein [Alphaproteobacteria bacterium]